MEGNDWRTCIQMRKCKCMHVHACACMKIHKNANARTVGPINELLVVGECCFWTVSEESHACFSVPYRRYGKPVWRISNGYTKYNRNAMGHPSIMRRTGRSPVRLALSTGPIAFLLTFFVGSFVSKSSIPIARAEMSGPPWRGQQLQILS